MSKKVFISYRHTDGDWVWRRLKPCLEAGGATVLIDQERFLPGRDVYRQMDDLQDKAELNLLVLSDGYLQSDACKHEMERAIAKDPEFRGHNVIPVHRDDCEVPEVIAKHHSLRVKLPSNSSGYGDAEAWKGLLTACGANLGTCATRWLEARDEIAQLSARRENVSLHVDRGVGWRPLLEHLRTAKLPEVLLPDLKVVDLEDGRTVSRPGLLRQILEAIGHRTQLPEKPRDLVEFSEILEAAGFCRLALTHFDFVATPARQKEYDVDLFAALRHLAMEPKKKLGLLLVSHAPFGTLLPPWHPLSEIEVKTVRLQSTI